MVTNSAILHLCTMLNSKIVLTPRIGPLTEDELYVCDPSYVNSYKNVFSITTKVEVARYMLKYFVNLSCNKIEEDTRKKNF